MTYKTNPRCLLKKTLFLAKYPVIQSIHARSVNCSFRVNFWSCWFYQFVSVNQDNFTTLSYEFIYLEGLVGQHDRAFQASPSGLVFLGLLEFKDEENGNKIKKLLWPGHVACRTCGLAGQWARRDKRARSARRKKLITIVSRLALVYRVSL